MKLLFDYQAFYNQKVGGISRSKISLINEFKLRKDVYVSLFTLFTFNFHFNKKKYYLFHLDDKFESLLFKFKKIGRLVSRYVVNFKLLYFPPEVFIPTYYDCYFLKSIGQTPFVVTIHDMIHELFLFNECQSIKIIKQKKSLLISSKAIIAISNNTKNDILKIYPNIPEEKIHVVYWGNPMEKFTNNIYNFKKKNQLLYIGKRDGYKNFSWFIEAIAGWIITNNFTLICIGGESFSDLEIETFNILMISDKIFQKNVSDEKLALIYNESFALVVPSLYEGFCFPIIEAMSLRCPVVYANNSCMPEIASFAGIAFDQNNKIHLVECLNKLLISTQFYNYQIELGIKQSIKFTWSDCADNTKKVYDKCLL